MRDRGRCAEQPAARGKESEQGCQEMKSAWEEWGKGWECCRERPAAVDSHRVGAERQGGRDEGSWESRERVLGGESTC